MDEKAEAITRNLYTIVCLTVCPTIVGALVSQTLTECSKMLLSGLQAHQASPNEVAIADQLVQGLKLVCESALDTIPLLARASSQAVVLLRLIWLNNWSTDQSSKKALMDLPFKGDRLFGASMDGIIKDATGGKSTLLPQS